MRRRRDPRNALPPGNPLTEACRSPALWLLVLFAIGGLLLRGYDPRKVAEPGLAASDRGATSEVAIRVGAKQDHNQMARAASAAVDVPLLPPTERAPERGSVSSIAPRIAAMAPTNVESVAAWADADLKGALDWAIGAGSRIENFEAVVAVSEIAARTEPVAAVDVVAGLEPSSSRDRALTHAVSQWADTQPEQAAEWAGKVQDPELRNELVAAVAVASAEEHPEFAGDLVAANLAAGPAQNNAIVSVVQRWVQSAPHAAAAWVSEFPESPVRTAAADNLFNIWTAQDRPGAEHYIDQLPQGWLREVGQLALSRTPSSADVQPGDIPQQVVQ